MGPCFGWMAGSHTQILSPPDCIAVLRGSGAPSPLEVRSRRHWPSRRGPWPSGSSHFGLITLPSLPRPCPRGCLLHPLRFALLLPGGPSFLLHRESPRIPRASVWSLLCDTFLPHPPLGERCLWSVFFWFVHYYRCHIVPRAITEPGTATCSVKCLLYE